MIMNSFLFLQGIGRRGESKLWNKGIRNWDDFLRAKSIAGISSARKAYYDRKIIEARKNLFSLNSSYFYDKLPASEQWRLYEFFKEDAVFLDIETTGLSDNAQVTVVGLFDGIDTKTMIRNINFDEGILKNEILKYKLVVTFNGASFDIPFLSKRYQNLVPRIPHFDLRFACSRIGLKGGLKTIERKLGIERQNNIVRELRGGDAIELWKTFKVTGDSYYLKLLIEYNEEDIINLKLIANRIYEILKKNLMPDCVENDSYLNNSLSARNMIND